MHSVETVRNRIGVDEIPTVAIVTYVIALVSWLAIVGRWLPMPGGSTGAGMGMSDPGAPEAMALSNGISGVGLYLVMWGVMMIAMMYPSSVPFVRLYSRTLEGTTTAGKIARIGAVLGTYTLVWTATGIVPLAVNAAAPIATIADTYGGILVGGSLLLLSGYQLSPYKYQCLKHCRSPLGFLMSNHQPGVSGAIRMSWDYSIFCVGCCWALFAVVVVVGSMNILWMALVAVVLSLERVVSWGERLSRAVGVLAGPVGLVVIAISLL